VILSIGSTLLALASGARHTPGVSSDEANPRSSVVVLSRDAALVGVSALVIYKRVGLSTSVRMTSLRGVQPAACDLDDALVFAISREIWRQARSTGRRRTHHRSIVLPLTSRASVRPRCCAHLQLETSLAPVNLTGAKTERFRLHIGFMTSEGSFWAKMSAGRDRRRAGRLAAGCAAFSRSRLTFGAVK